MADPLVEMLRHGSRQEAVSKAIADATDLYHTAAEGGDQQREYGTAILQCSDPQGNTWFEYAPPNAGPKGGAWETRLKLPQGCKVDAIMHTHPNDAKMREGGPSPHDKDVARALRVPSYVATPGLRRGDPTNVHEMQPDGRLTLNGQRERKGWR